MAKSKQVPAAPPPPLHVVVFPWLAFGHIIPFLELAQQLARRGHFVTFLHPEERRQDQARGADHTHGVAIPRAYIPIRTLSKALTMSSLRNSIGVLDR
jgi:hypothetical protein